MDLGMVLPRRKSLLLVLSLIFLTFSPEVFAHNLPSHSDPELLTGWQTWLHLTIQWLHLVAFSLWLGLTAGTLVLGLKPPLDYLLYSSWVLFLLLFATGTYNMEFSAGIPVTPSVFQIPLLEEIPYGVTYTFVLAIKGGLYGLTVLFTFVITGCHVWRRMDEARLRRIFQLGGSALGLLLALATAILLFYHEVADLWPTPIHSLGGLLGPEGVRHQIAVDPGRSPPNDFGLLTTSAVWTDIGLRWLHLLAFGLWVGSSAWITVFPGAQPERYIRWSWFLIVVQIASGIGNMERWTPFYVAPYPWNLRELSHLRFGSTYTLWMVAKHALALAGLAVLAAATFRFLRSRRLGIAATFRIKPYAALTVLIGFAIGYIMIALLLLHEGVDHAL